MVMQNSDNPGMVVVNVLLIDSNILTWSRYIKRALAAKNKLGFVNGSIVKPTNESSRGK